MSGPAAETEAWAQAYAAPELARRRQRTYTAKLRRLGLLEPVTGATLDVACGHGDALRVLAEHGQARLAGVDLSHPAGPLPAFARVTGAGERLPFAGASFDRILCLHSLHHFRSMDDVGLLLAECRRTLTPGGRLYLLDHWGSVWLRALFRVLEWNCPLYPAAARHFGQQLREEHEAIFWWLRVWPQLYDRLDAAGFTILQKSRTPSFLYLTCKADG